MEWFCIWHFLKGGSSIATSMVLEESPDRMLYYCITNYYILQIIIYYYHAYNDHYICISHLILSYFDMDIVYVFGWNTGRI